MEERLLFVAWGGLEYGKTRALLTRESERCRRRLPPRGTEQGGRKEEETFLPSEAIVSFFRWKQGWILCGRRRAAGAFLAASLPRCRLGRWHGGLTLTGRARRDGFEALAAWDVTLRYKTRLGVIAFAASVTF